MFGESKFLPKIYYSFRWEICAPIVHFFVIIKCYFRVKRFLQFSSFPHEEFHFFPCSSQGIENRENNDAYLGLLLLAYFKTKKTDLLISLYRFNSSSMMLLLPTLKVYNVTYDGKKAKYFGHLSFIWSFTYTLVKVQTREGVGNPNNQSLVFQFLILSKKYRQRIKYTRYDQNI